MECTQEEMWAAAAELHDLLAENGPRKATTDSPGSWRLDEGLFKHQGDCTLQLGVINMSPAWFQLGHEVSSNRELELSYWLSRG